MSEESPGTEEQDLELSTTQLVLAILFGLLMAYLSFAYTRYTQLPASQRTLTNFFLPFGESRSAQKLHKDGVRHYRSGQYKQAVSLFRQSLEREPGNYKGVFLMGGALIRLDQYQAGLELLRKVEVAKPDFARIYAKQAYVFLGLGRYAKAREKADRYVNQPGVPDKNRVYAVLIKLAANRLTGEEHQMESNPVETARGLNLPPSSLPLKLVDLLVGDQTVEKLLAGAMNRGEETEIRTWGAVRYLIEDRTEEARSLLRWVVSQGDEARYEYDLARAILHRTGAGGSN